MMAELEQIDNPFRPLNAVFVLMLIIVAYEYGTGHEIISIIVTGHLLFEISLLCTHAIIENLCHYNLLNKN